VTTIHFFVLGLSASLLLVGSYGFLRREWNVWLLFVFDWLAVCLFFFGVLPTQFPDWSLA
jgi:hypothetical protein